MFEFKKLFLAGKEKFRGLGFPPETGQESSTVVAVTTGFIGALLLSLSITENTGEVVQLSNGVEYHGALVNTLFFKMGIFFLVFNYIFQLLGGPKDLTSWRLSISAIIVVSVAVIIGVRELSFIGVVIAVLSLLFLFFRSFFPDTPK